MAKKKQEQKTNIDLQNITQKNKEQATLKARGELMCSRRVNSSFSTCGTRRVKSRWQVMDEKKDRIVITTNWTYIYVVICDTAI